MDRLYAPWRREYHTNKRNDCVFCDIASSREFDDENEVFYRDDICFFVMNRFPYNPGHFMIIPNRHVGEYEDLSDEEVSHIAKLAKKGVKILKEFGASGINMGWNIGFDAGAGIPEHLHLHLVPRFKRDTNMMTTVFNTRVYSADFDKIYEEIKKIANKYL
ncbi:HIT domain-containing protein [Caminibacter profundus]